jgi:hypothetical protein
MAGISWLRLMGAVSEEVFGYLGIRFNSSMALIYPLQVQEQGTPEILTSTLREHY